ncbi:dephospho-CoA kinase [Methyloterricola oryzae]|uniref:dephospho-CoA kinase n=1 Tax=Methyloterricola oryzae TaxID=1495050 RepID=UPI0005EB3E80|nr:dephospho-CoA kinase [Methyloterricola oryzae]
MLKVGLTGGIGCGKSAVADLFRRLDVPVLDADEIARALVEPGQPALSEIAESFGPQALDGGRLNRAWLRETVFRNANDKKRLESILHPRVYASMEAQMANLDAAYCILMVPLLLETGRRDFVDRLLVVDCPVETQIARVTRRDGLDEAAVRRIIESQMARAERLAAANDLIENDGDLEALEARVAKLHLRYLETGKSLGQLD